MGSQEAALPPERLEKETVTQGDESLDIADMELKEEWQDDGFPRPLPEEISGEDLEGSSSELSPVALNTLELCGRRHMKRRLPAPELGDGSVKSDEFPERTPDGSLDIDVDELETPSESELQESHGFEWDDDLPRVQRVDGDLGEKFYTNRVRDIRDPDGQTWRIFLTDDQAHRVDLSAVGPYKKVISHGGYDGEGLNAIMVFAVCYLPDSSIPDYSYIMENLFWYILGALEMMVAQNYILVCLSGAAPRSRLPSFAWIKQCYQTIDRSYRKNLKSLLIVHPAWYVKALMAVFRPFISSKFSRKVQFVDNLADLARLIPLDQAHIPDPVRRLDQSGASSQS